VEETMTQRSMFKFIIGSQVTSIATRRLIELLLSGKLLSTCPFFSQLDAVWGNRPNVIPPILFESGTGSGSGSGTDSAAATAYLQAASFKQRAFCYLSY
jgi:hypothetical protein